MEFKVKTLTPLWTGSVVSSHMDRIHETNIVGSLRWWYEAILRGLGVNVCNPTSGNPKERCSRENGLCEACIFFGATGWQRQFRIRLKGGEALLGSGRTDLIPFPSGRIHERKGHYYAGRWFLVGGSMTGNNISMQFVPLGKQDLSCLRLVMALIDRHATIGGKVSNGYGVLMVRENAQPLAVEEALNNIRSLKREANRDSMLPDLRDFFFAKLRFKAPKDNSEWWKKISGIDLAVSGEVVNGNLKVNLYDNNDNENNEKSKSVEQNLSMIVNKGLLPLAPAIRNYLRYLWDSTLTPSEKNYLFGTTETVCPHCCSSWIERNKYDKRSYWCKNCQSSLPRGQEWERIASKINVSHAYRLESGEWEFRIWGWVPSQMPLEIGFNRDKFLNSLQDALKDTSTWSEVSMPVPQLEEWHTMDSAKKDGFEYLRELLESDKKEGGA
ncbi:MAG TPA: type III-B CRISPR module RAMP protein Cmr1 [Firmicutes bacterium]|nr:type III-B CRISPR module RAMP protein Cmr1 [Bacillota bacterium]